MNVNVNPDELYGHYQELQRYVGWTEEDARRVMSVAELLDSQLAPLIDDFYAEINRHPEARSVITGGQEQIQRLKGTLLRWLRELLSGPYDAAYALRRWQVGWRHVEIGLDQVYTNVALSRLRRGLMTALQNTWSADALELRAVIRSLNTLIDLDLALIEDAYQAEYSARLQRYERLKAKEQSEAAFRSLVEAAPCLIVILRPDQRIVYLSPFAQRLIGCQVAEVLGSNYLTMFIAEPALHESIGHELNQVAAGKPARGLESPILYKDKSLRWIVWNAEWLHDYEGAPAILAVGLDVTEQKIAQEQALQAERLAALGQMTAGLAHESRNALQLIQANLEMLELEVEDRPEALQLIASIQGAEDRLHRLFEDVRGYAAPINLEREDYDLSRLWRNVWQQLVNRHNGRSIELSEDIEQADPICSVDLFSIERVFRNIFDNALDACSGPARIEVGCRSVNLRGKPATEVSIRDNGPGLSAEQRQKVFQPFFTTKRQGTGLGLAIVKRIVEAHGGEISICSANGGGAEIVVTLPRGN
jgi:two-component system sensor kinase FixL